MARRVIDLARTFAVIAGPDPEDPSSSPRLPPDVLGGIGEGIEGVRILVPRGFFFDEADPEVASAVRRAADLLAGLGARVEEGALAGAEDAQRHLMPVIYADAASFHRERLEMEPGRFGRDVRARLQPGLELRAIDYAAAMRWVEGFRRQMADLFASGVDAVLTPAAPCVAPVAEGVRDVIAVTARLTRFTWAWSAARCPALALPCGFGRDGLPIGMQLAGPRWSEPLLLRVGHAYQRASDWHRRRPELTAR